MKIVQLIQRPQLRGAEIFISQLSGHLIRNGLEVMLVSLFPGEAHLPFSGELFRLDRPNRLRLFDWRGLRAFARLLRERDIDVVQANAGDTLKFAVMSKIVFGWKQPIVFRNANKISDFVNTKVKLYFNRFLVSHVSHVFSVSEECRMDFIKTFAIPQDRATTLPVGVEELEHSRALAPDVANFFSRSAVLLNVASLVPEKNHIGLLRISKLLLERNANFEVLIAGSGRLERSIADEIKNRGLSEKVHLLGAREDVMTLMRHATVVVHPSLIEGLPAVILEAFYMKVPVVAYDVGGIGEIIKDGVTGRLMKKDNEGAFADAVRELLSNPSKRESITNNAYTLVTTSYLNRNLAVDFERAYKKLMSEQQR